MNLNKCEERDICMKKRGLAATCKEVRKRVASMGGKAAWATGRKFGFTSDTAKLAIKKRWDNKKAQDICGE